MDCSKCNEGCNDECHDPCQEDCGCGIELSADCVRLRKNYDCIGSKEGETVEQGFSKIDQLICDLSTSVDGDDGDSAYITWINLGNEGTEQDFIDSLMANCDCSPEQVLYVEEEEITTFGTWANVALITSAVPLEVASTIYNVPVGGAGDYEVNIQATGYTTAQAKTFYVAVFVNDLPIDNGFSPCSVDFEKNPYGTITLHKSNITLAETDKISMWIAYSGAEGNTFLKWMKYKLTKLP